MDVVPSSDSANIKKTPSTVWAGFTLCLAVLAYFLFFYHGYVERSMSAARWLRTAWNAENDYEHGWMVPLISLYMVGHAVRQINKRRLVGSLHGLWILALGSALSLLAVRTQQGRMAIGAVPFLLTGIVWCYWGSKAALKLAFPFFFLWMSIPLPGFQQATVGMQLMATQAAHWGAEICGVQTIVEGTNIRSASGNWDTYSIAGGCSGMRSLMALLMFTVAWSYLADNMTLWKRIVLALSAIPLSIAANAFRVASIFVFAEYVNPAFAGKTWHDWSGLLFFFPASLVGLVILHGVLAGEIPFLRRRKTVTLKHRPTAPETHP